MAFPSVRRILLWIVLSVGITAALVILQPAAQDILWILLVIEFLALVFVLRPGSPVLAIISLSTWVVLIASLIRWYLVCQGDSCLGAFLLIIGAYPLAVLHVLVLSIVTFAAQSSYKWTVATLLTIAAVYVLFFVVIPLSALGFVTLFSHN